MVQLGRGMKKPKTVAGAPFPPAQKHTDGPDHPRRDVPTADPDPEAEPATEQEEERP